MLKERRIGKIKNTKKALWAGCELSETEQAS